MTNSADLNQLASSEANWYRSTLFAKTGHVIFSKRRIKWNKNIQDSIGLHLDKSQKFLFLHKNVCCGDSLEVPHWGIYIEYPQHVFVEK